MEQQHTIGKFSLEVQLPSRQDVFSLQSRLSNRCTGELAPLLAALLDSWTAPDELLQIDKLEIDLGICTPETLEKELPQLIIAFLQKRFPGMRQQTYLEEGMSRITLGQGYFDSWLYFLEQGILPHTAVRWTRQEWEAGILETLSAESTAYLRCAELLISNNAAVKRLLLQFSPEFVRNWLLAFSGSTYQPLLQLVTEWETFYFHPKLSDSKLAALIPVQPARTDFHVTVMHWMIEKVVLQGRTIETPVLLKELMELQVLPVQYWLYIFQQLSAGVKETLPLLQKTALVLSEPYGEVLSTIDKELALKTAQMAFKEMEQLLAAKAEATQVRGTASEPVEKAVPATSPDVTASTETKAVSKSENVTTVDDPIPVASELPQSETPEADIPPGTTLYINNAGLILLHPYLGILFDALNLRDKEGFKDLHKAIQLLGYLASGEDDIPEYDLVLPKLLCGILPSQPVKRFISLTEEEKKEADELLLSVIEHWNALGSTTPDGLRGNFLMREGKLEWKDEEWQLYVTQQPYDMLLNRLPWGFSVVGLSWMPWLIKTVWT